MLCATIFAVFAVAKVQPATGVWNPVPFTIQVSGTVNGVDFSVEGPGTVDPIGTYATTLTFSNMPPNFHPVFMTAYTVSICCYYYAEETQGGMNLHTLLGDDATYNTVRDLTFPATGDSLTITGTVTSIKGSPGFVGTISGTTSDPGDLAGESHYEADITPAGAGKTESSASGYFRRSSGESIPVTVSESISFDTRFSLPFAEKRVVDETGSLNGLTYTLVLDSVVFRHGVGGVWVPIDKFGLLAPSIGLTSAIIAAAVAIAIYAKRLKRRDKR